MDLLEADILGDAIGEHWYYRCKARAVEALVAQPSPGRILDVGAGSGFFSRHLLTTTHATEAVCVDTSYNGDSSETSGSGRVVHKRRSIDSSDADLVLLMDVLEHVDDDLGLLAHYAAMSPPRSRFLITVPAFQWLWSSHDEFLGHRRRYTARAVRQLARRAGLELDVCHYFFGLVLPLAMPGRLLERLAPPGQPPKSSLRRHHPWVDAALGALCDLELPLMRHNRLAGLSVFCLAHKP